MNPTHDDDDRDSVPFTEMGDELLERVRETAKKIEDRVKKVVDDPKGVAETKEMPTVDTKEMPVIPPDVGTSGTTSPPA